MNYLQIFTKCYSDLVKTNKELAESTEYQSLLVQKEQILGKIKTFEEKRKQVLENIDDSKRYLLVQANQENLEEIGEYKVKWKEKKVVDSAAVYNVVGDIDAFISVSSISQKDLKTYAKERKDIKKPILNCIKVISREAVDII